MHWNQFFNALIYSRDEQLVPLQIVLREILIMNSSAAIDDLMADITEEQLLQMTKREYLQALIQFALIVVSRCGAGRLPVRAEVLRARRHDRGHQGMIF